MIRVASKGNVNWFHGSDDKGKKCSLIPTHRYKHIEIIIADNSGGIIVWS